MRFQVLSEGERGLLGVGYEPARVVATRRRATAPSRAPRRRERGRPRASATLLEHVTAAIGVRCRIEVDETDDDDRASTCSATTSGS